MSDDLISQPLFNDTRPQHPHQPHVHAQPRPERTAKEAAIKYCTARGWAVFPLVRGGKKPATKNGFHDAVNDLQAALELFRQPRYRNANIGIATGQISGGLLAVDTDNHDGEDGEARLRELEAQYGPLPPTYTVRTGSGGWHRYFRLPPGVRLGCTTGVLGSGIDTRCDGGYVVAPPSITTTPPCPLDRACGPYTVELDLPVTDAPQWLIDLLQHGGDRVNGYDHTHAAGAGINDDLSAGIGRDWSPTSENVRLICCMLLALDPRDYAQRDPWLRILMALKSLGWGKLGEEIARRWSKQPGAGKVADRDGNLHDGYDETVFAQTWNSLKAEGGVTVGTLWHDSVQAGWQPPKPAPRFDTGSPSSQGAQTDTQGDTQQQADAGTANDTPDPLTQEIERLAALSYDLMIAALVKKHERDYENIRVPLADRLGMRVPVLDKRVEKARGGSGDDGLGGRPLTWPEIEPWPLPVDGVDLLDEIVAVIRRYIVCDREAADTASLWIVMTHLFESVRVGTRLFISAPEKNCGKTNFLEIVAELSRRPLQTASVTPAALFRAIDECCPTILIDEADNIPREALELRAVMNSGHTRASATVLRTVGDDHKPRKFSTWAPMALAGIGRLTDTVMSRAIVLSLRRRLVSERVEQMREPDKAKLDPLRQHIVRWAADNAASVATACANASITGDWLHGRNADNWEALLAIAHVAGGTWPERARRASVVHTHDAAKANNDGVGVTLLTAIRDVFARLQTDKIPSTELCTELNEDEQGPWATWHRGHGIMPHQVAKLLRGFGIKSKNIRFTKLNANLVAKGYSLEQFAECFERYLDPADNSGEPRT
ncbi:MAG TPA: DUF3631 domain-containing protein [Paraburkholderia sp.]|jgi:hypothetical protein